MSSSSSTTYIPQTSSVATAISYSSQVIVHIDLDAFYAQVEIQRCQLDPSLPVAVQQWEALIAVNYPARARGVSRLMGAAKAKAVCPELILVHVETLDKDGNRRSVDQNNQDHTYSTSNSSNTGSSNSSYNPPPPSVQMNDKVSLLRYREASLKIFSLLLQICEKNEKILEKASVDEAYIDITFLVERYLKTGTLVPSASTSSAPSIFATLPLFKYTETGTDDHPSHTSTIATPSVTTSSRSATDKNNEDPSNNEEEDNLANPSAKRVRYTLPPLSNATEQYGYQAINEILHDPQCFIVTATEPDYNGGPSSSSSSFSITVDSSVSPLQFTSPSDARLAAGGLIARYIRQIIFKELGYTSSTGIAPNKMLAKLASTRHKPNAQTIIPIAAVPDFIHRTPLKKIRFLGGLLGEKLLHEVVQHGYASPEVIEAKPTFTYMFRKPMQPRIFPNRNPLDVEDNIHNNNPETDNEDDPMDSDDDEEIVIATVVTAGSKPPLAPVTAGQAQQLSLAVLNKSFGDETGIWIYRILRGMDDSAIIPRLRPKSMLAAKSFASSSCRTFDDACGWLRMLSAELVQRMKTDEEAYHRQAKSLVLHYRRGDNTSRSRVGTMPPVPRTVDSVLYAASLLLKKAVEEELAGTKSQTSLLSTSSGSSSSSSSHGSTGNGISNGGGLMFRCSHLALGATNFIDTQVQGMSNIASFFQPKTATVSTTRTSTNDPYKGGNTADSSGNSDTEVQIITVNSNNHHGGGSNSAARKGTESNGSKLSSSVPHPTQKTQGIMAAFQRQQQQSSSRTNTPDRNTSSSSSSSASSTTTAKVSEVIDLLDDSD